MSLQTMKAYLYDLFCTVRSEVIRNWVNIGRQNKIKYSDFVRMTNFEDSVMFHINIPQDIVHHLETEAREVREYKGVYLFYSTFLLFTRGIELNEKDFDLIAQGAIYQILVNQCSCEFCYSYFTLLELSFIIEKLILPYLTKRKAPKDIIKVLEEISKDIQLKDDFWIGSYPDPHDYTVNFRYSNLDQFNPVKEQIKRNEMKSKIKSN
ncbi:hypothetical protein TVAG_196740 [Trichomonas vaginalis G3]|uniref:Uncharacterized protein n=1 Tax=Trichomonas vaginalis (strain ATCC PRA-98 / G3) TaxID=412133 RepID=A2FCZ2_TRIV3|nr:hypothetical protein TVAGG3_0705400 [Trichomonas vaginalis G3]EAX97230.1 hypothetical protein TVAG_196740 [Trichomonas vaginalis G3]KAI5509537.1 hypothetical protein TVAGG3_0705400 [Trichomonas vaginalis G3]|eukprot:XP_001310160.1 hypothetical protein [Trichomonas vaginalis G3]